MTNRFNNLWYIIVDDHINNYENRQFHKCATIISYSIPNSLCKWERVKYNCLWLRTMKIKIDLECEKLILAFLRKIFHCILFQLSHFWIVSNQFLFRKIETVNCWNVTVSTIRMLPCHAFCHHQHHYAIIHCCN